MLSRKNFYISSKIFFTLISLIMLIPLTFLTIFFDFYSLRLLNREIASANRNALFLYQEQLEADLSQIETSMAQPYPIGAAKSVPEKGNTAFSWCAFLA